MSRTMPEDRNSGLLPGEYFILEIIGYRKMTKHISKKTLFTIYSKTYVKFL